MLFDIKYKGGKFSLIEKHDEKQLIMIDLWGLIKLGVKFTKTKLDNAGAKLIDGPMKAIGFTKTFELKTPEEEAEARQIVGEDPEKVEPQKVEKKVEKKKK